MKKRFLKIAAVLSSAMMLLTSCGGGGGTATEGGESGSGKTAKRELVVVDWGGTNTDARIEGNFSVFEKEHDCKVTVVTPCDYTKLQTMVDTNTVEWDVMNCDAYWGVLAGNTGYLEPIDYSVVTAKLNPETTSEYVCSAEIYSSIISWNSNKYTEDTAPKTWAEFWDTEKYPGKRAMWQYPVTVIEAALMADGVAPADLYPLDLDRAFKKLDEIKKDIVWWKAGAQPSQMLSSGEADLALAWSGRIANAAKDGSPVDFRYEQAIIIPAGWVIPKGAPHKEIAQEFLAFMSEPDMMLAFSERIPYGASNLDAVDQMSPELKEALGQTDEQLATEVYLNNAYWAENLSEVEAKFNEWLVK